MKFLQRIKQNTSYPLVFFKENGTDITDNINIANKFNTFFLQMSVRKLQKIFYMKVTRITVII